MSAEIFQLDHHRRRAGYRIRVAPGLWRGFEVTVEPPTATHRMQHFRTRAEAMDFAAALQRVEGWPIDATDADPTPPGGWAA